MAKRTKQIFNVNFSLCAIIHIKLETNLPAISLYTHYSTFIVFNLTEAAASAALILLAQHAAAQGMQTTVQTHLW